MSQQGLGPWNPRKVPREMTADQEEPGRRVHLSIYLPGALAKELRDFLKQIPYGGGSMSSFVETAIRRELDRAKAESESPPKK